MFEYIVEVQQRTLNEENHSRLTSEHELARAYLNDRRIKKAIDILEHVVAIDALILAQDDPDVSISKDLLASAYRMLEFRSSDELGM